MFNNYNDIASFFSSDTIDTITINVLSNWLTILISFVITAIIPSSIYFLFSNRNKYKRLKARQFFSFFTKHKKSKGIYYSTYDYIWTEEEDISQENLITYIDSFNLLLKKLNFNDVDNKIHVTVEEIERKKINKQLILEKLDTIKINCNRKKLDIDDIIKEMNNIIKITKKKVKKEVIEIIVINNKFYGYVLPNEIDGYRKIIKDNEKKQSPIFRFEGEFYENLLIGHWVDPTNPTIYYGTLTFLKPTNDKSFNGKWLGENKDKKEIDTGNWNFTYKYNSVKKYKKETNLEGNNF